MPKPPRRTRTFTLGRALGLTVLGSGLAVLGATVLSGIDPDLWTPPLPASESSPDRAESRVGEEAVPSEDPHAPIGLTVAPADFVPATPDPAPADEYTDTAGPEQVGAYTTVHVTVANRTDGELDVSPEHFVLVGSSGARHDSADGAGAAEDQISSLTLLPRQTTSGTISAPGTFTPSTVELLEAPRGEAVHEAPVHP